MILKESFGYASEAVMGKWKRWILLIIASIIFPVMVGYAMEIYRGKKPAPELEHWGKLFIDGLKLFVAGIIYAIPLIIVFFLTIGMAVLSILPFMPGTSPDAAISDPTILMKMLPALGVGLLICLIIAVLIALVSMIGFVRMARTNKFGEAFAFHAILETIGKIGWGSYILSLILLWIVIAIIMIILELLTLIPIVGWIILFIFIPVVTIFEARYVTMVYDTSGV